MKLLDRIQSYGQTRPDTWAVISNEEKISYGKLVSESDKLAAFLDKELGDNKTPLMVYGHKNPSMMVCFLACVKSGRGYCPVDVTVPLNRVEEIANTIGAPFVLATEELTLENQRIISKVEIMDIIEKTTDIIDPSKKIEGDQVFYIIFTSGSTGRPKGVQITYDNLTNYLEWSIGMAGTDGRDASVFMNQAPFSFDLSVMDLYNCLYSGGTLWTVDKATQSNMQSLLNSLEASNTTVWVSTPSFADICLSNPEFDSNLMNKLETFLFCGETLTVETASRLKERFPNSKIFNLYGPTEATVSATAVEITQELIDLKVPLPVGYGHEGTEILIMGPEGQYLPEGEKGEIIIKGNTVSPGYFQDPEKTAAVFLDESRYKTGDEGYLKDGCLYYSGRIDLQIKMHGYRIELGDIENNLLKLDHVLGAAVLPKYKDEKIRSLVAFVVLETMPEKDIVASKEIKEAMKDLLPDYMIPKKFIFVDKLPVTANGKVDRKSLEGRL